LIVTLPEDFAMNRSRDVRRGLLPQHSALQHERGGNKAPRPLPLFLELIREASERDPDLARDALVGLRAYEAAAREAPPAAKPEVARVAGACLRDHGGDGPAAVLIPSLINPPRILDLDAEVSLARAVSTMGRRALLLDWGAADMRSGLSIAAHVDQLLAPLLRELGEPVALIGYCLGGTMSVAAANCVPCERVVTLAAPWNFALYPEASQAGLRDMWRHSKATARTLGALPMEVLQASFWSLDPERTVRKFADFGRFAPGSADVRRFVALEDWANEGEPLPYPAAEELLEDLFGRNLSGSGRWRVCGKVVGDRLAVPALHLCAERDRIAPAASAAAGKVVRIPAGHVGMIVGSAKERLHRALKDFLTPCR
jgi:polyhydroxyalkanoate synthase